MVIGNPKGWLGNAYHSVLEKIADIDLEQGSIDEAVDWLWQAAVSRQHERNSHHELDRRFGSPETWPGYYLAKASVRLRAREVMANVGTRDSRQSSVGEAGGGGNMRERNFVAFGGRLAGRPDVIRLREVIDFKSGAILELDEVSGSKVVKLAYLRQLRIYAFLVNEVLGWWPERARLLPLAGPGIEVSLDPAACIIEATEAVSLLETYNDALRAEAQTSDLASPSPPHCRWCPYKLVCSPFWQSVTPEWSGQLDGAALEGEVAEAPRSIYTGQASALVVDVQAGNELPRRVNIAPLSVEVHPVVASLCVGDRVRVISLRVRRDGVLVPTDRTVVARIVDLPVVRTGKDPAAAQSCPA